MGCSATKDSTISELNSMITHIKAEKLQLQRECERLKSQKDSESTYQDKLEGIESMNSEFETQLKTMNELLAQLTNESKIAEFSEDKKAKVLNIQTELKRKALEIGKEFPQVFKEERLEGLLKESHMKLEEMETLLVHREQGVDESFVECYDTEEKLLRETDSVHNKSHEDYKEGESDYLNLSEYAGAKSIRSDHIESVSFNRSEVAAELQRVDTELEELNECIKAFRSREEELQMIEKRIKHQNRSENLHLLKFDLKSEIKNSELRLKMLENERMKVKEEITKIKKMTANNGFGMED